MTAPGLRGALLATALALAATLAPLPAAADQVSTATAMQTDNGCVANAVENCTTFATYPVVLNVSVTSSDGTIPTGTVTIYNSTVWGATGNPIGTVTLDNNGNAQYQGPALPVGQYFLHATYNGDAAHALSASYVMPFNVQPLYDTVYLYWSSNTSQAGQPITYSIQVIGNIWGLTPTGTVYLYDQATLLASATLVGDTGPQATTSRATIVYALTTVGTHYVYVDYPGDANFEGGGSSSYPDITITQATPALSLSTSSSTSVAGQSITLTATLTNDAAPSGSVTFTDGGTVIGSAPISNDQAAFTTSSLSVGAHTLQATYAGDANNAAAASPTLTDTVAAAPTTTSLTDSRNSEPYYTPLTLTATVTSAGPAPTGTVTFYDGSTSIGSAPVAADGTASLSIQTLVVGAHSLTAAYSGDANDVASTSSALSQTVTQDGTTTGLTSSQNPDQYQSPTTVTATVTSTGPTPTGTVTFYDGSFAIATVTLGANGTATLNIQNLAIGSHNLTAVYMGDGNNLGSNSLVVTQTVTRDTTTTALTASATTISHGKTITFTATVTSSYSATPPTGTVTFWNGTTKLGTVTLVNGVARLNNNNLSTGTHNITATYAGSTTQAGSTSPVLVITITH